WGVCAWRWSPGGLWVVTLPQPNEKLALEAAAGARKPVWETRTCTPVDRVALGEALHAWLQAYLEGGWWEQPAIPLNWTGFPPFYREVLSVVGKIPPGQVRTYGAVARQVGNPRAARAVGGALKANPFALLIPCHRVVAKDGPGGFAGKPASQLKEKLLAWEVTG
ncbi:MAG: MGMT family protein, partial [Heliobacteriaceae bacterium]|nr:MGMT family protein [Heliobacteriaceae bacterium]